MVRAGTTGFTGVIDPNGQIIASLPLFTKAELTYDVPIYDGPLTIYTKYGQIIDKSPYVLLLVSFLLAIIRKFTTKKSK